MAGDKKMRYFLSCLLLAGSATGAFSQPRTIGVDEYMQRVIDYSHQLQIARDNTVSAEESQAVVRTGFLPRLDAGGNYSYQFKKIGFDIGGASFNMKPQTYQAEAALVQNIYSGSAVRNQYRMAELETEISRLTERMTLDNVAYAAEYNYWNFAASEELMDISTRNLEIVNRLYNLVNERFNGGLIARTDVLMVETRLKEAEFQHANVLNTYKVAGQNFNILMGEAPDRNFAIADTILMAVVPPSFLPLDSVLSRRPDYQIALRDIRYQEYGVKLSRSQYNPQLVGGVQGNWGTQMLNFDGKTIWNGAAYVQLNVPIFHWNERRHAVRAAQAQVNAAERQRLQVIDNVEQDLNNAMTNIQETARQVQITRAS